MTQQLDLFALPTTPPKATPARKVKLRSLGRGWSMPTGFPTRTPPSHADHQTPDGRWYIEANEWAGGPWCVFDMHDQIQRDEALHGWTLRRYYDPEVPYTLHPIPGEAGTVVKTLDEAKELIAEAIA
jgi:hypothetical protein